MFSHFVRHKAIFGLICVLAICVAGCGIKPQPPQAELDTPDHHVMTGNKFLKANKLVDARREFVRATELDPKYAPAFVGLGLVASMSDDFEAAVENMETADKYAKGSDQEVEVCTGFIRMYTLGKEKVHKRWLARAENRYAAGEKLDEQNAGLSYYMGIAYREAYEFEEAEDLFRKVIKLDSEYFGEADAQWKEMQKIVRAMPGTKVGKKIALLPSINRADVAALFIQELKVDELFAKRTPKTFDNDFKSPEKKFVTDTMIKTPKAVDIENHVLRADIEAVMKQQIKGLEASPEHKFEPDNYITRAEYAMMMEDIIIKISGDDKLATKFIGQTSPFADVRSDVAYFNAAMVCTTRNIMETTGLSTGEFDPMGMVSGADALLGIRVMKNELKSYF